MVKIWITATVLFLIITFIFWKLTIGHFKKDYNNKMWILSGTRTFYWQGSLLISGGATVLVIFLLKAINIFSF
ncbi:hypothetical protein CW733_05120 [Lacinutrix sp. Bg11-31]|nr:hypothetical protein CW733_05120 [Lacinutrix sp. Bg11-31]